MPQDLIDGVQVKQLKILPDDQGTVVEVLRTDDQIFHGCGEIYFTTAYSGAVRAWYVHESGWDHRTCVRGMTKLVLYDARKESPTKGEFNEFFLGMRNMQVVAIPPGVFHGFECLSSEECLMLGISAASEAPVPRDNSAIPYAWNRKNQ